MAFLREIACASGGTGKSACATSWLVVAGAVQHVDRVGQQVRHRFE
jgi:hypothetical protein